MKKYAGNRYEAVTRYFKSSRCTFKLSITYTEVDDSRQMYFFDRKDKGCPILGEYMTHLRKHSTWASDVYIRVCLETSWSFIHKEISQMVIAQIPLG